MGGALTQGGDVDKTYRRGKRGALIKPFLEPNLRGYKGPLLFETSDERRGSVSEKRKRKIYMNGGRAAVGFILAE